MSDEEKVLIIDGSDKKETIHSILCKIQSELTVKKGQKNKFGNYMYRSCEDITEGLTPLLGKYDVCLVLHDEIFSMPCDVRIQIKDEIHSSSCRIYIKATATLTYIDGSSISASAYAREAETKKGMDVSQVTGASSSYARKYALQGLLAIDDGEDSDCNDNREQSKTVASRAGRPVIKKSAPDKSTDDSELLDYYSQRIKEAKSSDDLVSVQQELKGVTQMSQESMNHLRQEFKKTKVSLDKAA